MLVAVVAVVGMKALTSRYERTITREQLLAPDARQPRTDLSEGLNYLLVGTDRRGASDGPDQRSDTILIVHLPPGMRQGYLISVPRDLLVAIPPAAPTATAAARTRSTLRTSTAGPVRAEPNCSPPP